MNNRVTEKAMDDSRPTVPSTIMEVVDIYGCARADNDARTSAQALGILIAKLRDWAAMLAASPVPAQPSEALAALDRMDALLDPERGLLSIKPGSATFEGCRADMATIRAALACQPAAASLDAGRDLDDKSHPRFMRGYDAGLKDGRAIGESVQDLALLMPEQRPEPVAVIHRNEAGQISMKRPDGEPFDMMAHVGTRLYAHPPAALDMKEVDSLINNVVSAALCHGKDGEHASADRLVKAGAELAECLGRVAR